MIRREPVGGEPTGAGRIGTVTIRRAAIIMVAFLASLRAHPVEAHPLGNFSVNRWAAIRAGERAICIDYVVDFAEIPTFQESPGIDADSDGRESEKEVGSFASARAQALAAGLDLRIDGARTPLRLASSVVRFSPGAGGLRTMRLEARYESGPPGALPEGGARITFRDWNFEGRAGWSEVIAYGEADAAVFEATVPATDRSRALSAYPADLITAPPQVTEAGFRLLAGEAAARARTAGTASVNPALQVQPAAARPPLADGLMLLMGPTSTRFGLGVLVAAFAAALFWGGAHALSPGHGKTVVAAYLVGQRGAPMHAVWLGVIVTITHTAGVFALGALTLLLSRWFVPESLYPWLAFTSGLTVLGMGGILLCRRLRGVHPHGHPHGSRPGSDHPHSHGAGGHTHDLPDRLSPRGLIALGMSGGIVPCPSALVVLLSAVAFHRVLFGMGLIIAFSVGLASVLVAVGLLMVYARHLFDRLDAGGVLGRRLSLVSAATIALLGAGIALKSAPAAVVVRVARAASLLSAGTGFEAGSGASLGILGLGLLFGLKHATEADHLAAVGSIVSENGGLRRALWTGGLWGAGHTLSILVAGLAVLGLHLVIPESTARWLELGVALMIVGLGGTALARALRNRLDVHVHAHAHGIRRHTHLHFHGSADGHLPAWGGAAGARRGLHAVHLLGGVGLKPLLVGMMHGLAGSAALTVLVLAQIRSAVLGIAYLLVFGAGSIGGMALMSVAIALPFAATAPRPSVNRGIRVVAGAGSLAFGLFYAWVQIGARPGP